MVNGSLQKRWFITDSTDKKKDVYLFGSVEYSSIPLKLKQWKRMVPGGVHELDLEMKELKISSECEKLGGNEQDFDNTFGVEFLWVLLSMLRKDRSKKIFTNSCTEVSIRHLLKNLQYIPLYNQKLLAFAICEWNLQQGFLNESFDCYGRTFATDFSKNSEILGKFWFELSRIYMNLTKHSENCLSKATQFFPLPNSLLENIENFHSSSTATAPLDPVQCIFGHFQGDNESTRHQYRSICMWLAINTRSSLELLLLDMNPIAALDMVKIIMQNATEMLSSEHLRSVQIILSAFLGNIGDVIFHDDDLMDSISFSDRFGRNISVTTVKESSVSSMCNTLLTLRQEEVGQHNSEDLFHQTLYATCFHLSFHMKKSMLQKTDMTSISDNDLLDFSVSQITSLMGFGLVEVAALNFYFTVATLINRHVPIGLDLGLYQPLEYEKVINAFAQVVGIAISPTERDAFLRSDNIRAALVLHRLFTAMVDYPKATELLVHSQGLLGLFVQLSLQVSSPTILDTIITGTQSDHIWMKETLLLRLWAIFLLDRLISLCNSRHRCSIPDPHYTVGARGLFLLAYQGVSLVAPLLDSGHSIGSFDRRDLLLDWIVPFKYFQLINIVVNDYPWDFANNSVMVTSNNNGTRIKVAFLSFFLRRHSVGRLLAKVISTLDRDVFDVWIVCQSKSRSSVDSTLEKDDIYDYLQSAVDVHNWIYLSEDLVVSAAVIRDLRLDILIFGDLFMDSFVTHLAMFRMAPVQVCFWGHPHTSGFPSIDYFITSDDFEPNVALYSRSHHFSEQLVRFDSLSFQMFPPEKLSGAGLFGNRAGGWCGCSQGVELNMSSNGDVRLLEREKALGWILMNGFDLYDAPVSAEAFMAPWRSKFCTQDSVSNKSSSAQCAYILSNIHLYGSLQSLMKMHPLFDRAIIGILRADPSAVILLLRNNRQLSWHRRLRNRLLAFLQTTENHHIAERIVFVSQRPHAEYMTLLCALDASLDPFPFGGGVTLCDSFGGSCARSRGSCGVPFVTSGELQSVHRIGVGLAKAFNSSHSARNSDNSNLLRHRKIPADSLTERLDSYIHAYVHEAIELRQQERICTNTNHNENVEHFIIYQSMKAVQEWEKFLIKVKL